LSLVGSCSAAFVGSIIFIGKFHMDAILNATLAGGVAIGAVCDVIIVNIYFN
jgi:hypothetical protein